MYKLKYSDCPERYTFGNAILPPGKSSDDFFLHKKVESKEPVIFILKKKVSTKRLFSYDLYSSTSIDIVSPRFAELLLHCENIFEDIQLLDAVLVVNGKRYNGYKGLNIIRVLPDAIDLEQSEYTDFSFAKFFYKTVFKTGIQENFNIARATCDGDRLGTIVISEKFRKFLEDNKIKGIDASKDPY